jgi:hypothetical protein
MILFHKLCFAPGLQSALRRWCGFTDADREVTDQRFEIITVVAASATVESGEARINNTFLPAHELHTTRANILIVFLNISIPS